ncbi:UNVERIFIED_CONTAM: hypothetical protein Sradi_4102400 [Sesamum radiatum]|uniref:Uncharacterized protein n=1 Tax=Sesamum radiatum TaxID=300843 RepID=A0AAW2P0C9_SESRA
MFLQQGVNIEVCVFQLEFYLEHQSCSEGVAIRLEMLQGCSTFVSNLQRHGVKVEAGSVLCGLVEEDVMHVLTDCSYARLNWVLSSISFCVTTHDLLGAEAWLRQVSRELD